MLTLGIREALADRWSLNATFHNSCGPTEVRLIRVDEIPANASHSRSLSLILCSATK